VKTPLERPALAAIDRAAIDRPMEWPRAVAIFGADARGFADRVASRMRELGADVRVLRVELRHAEGFDVEPDLVRAHPSALAAALEAVAREMPADRRTIGVGAAFAAVVRAELLVYVRGGAHPVSLSPEERELAKRAHLVLEEPREGAADALAGRLAAPRL
jgi:hypothetical protein